MGIRLFALCFGLFLLAPLRSPCADTTYVRFNTTLGNIDVQLLSDEAPNTVANFLTYVDSGSSGSYNNSFIHRSVLNFVIQGGGYNVVSNALGQIPLNRNYTTNPLNSEAGVSNTQGTIAMALSNGLNTGTDQWFFNLGDNSAALDGIADGGPFTVFGKVANANSLAVMDQIANVPVPSQEPQTLAQYTPLFDQTPLLNYTLGASLTLQNLIMVNSITRLTVQTFAAWQTAKFTAPQLAIPSFIAPASIPLNDGVPNLLKYLYNINPSGPMSANDRAALPVVGMTTISGTKYLTLTYRQNAQKIDASVYVQTSSDLQTWTTVANPTITPTGTTDSITHDPFMQVQVLATGTKQFIRLNVTQP